MHFASVIITEIVNIPAEFDNIKVSRYLIVAFLSVGKQSSSRYSK